MKSFFNDADGLNLVETIAIFVVFFWIFITIWILFNLNELTISFYNIFIWIPTTVIGGLFGQRITNQIIKTKL